jgi:glycosyltransferase involved in cell wall biosynthesis
LRKIKILFAPANTASMPDITMQALRKLTSVEVRGVSYGSHKYWTFGEGWKVINAKPFRKNPISAIISKSEFYYIIIKSILWADAIMWHWDIGKIECFLLKLFKKKIYVEWLGSDIRVPEILFELNPYYKKVWDDGEWDYYTENIIQSNKIQKKFNLIKAKALVCPEMSLFLNPIYFNSYISFMQRIDLINYNAVYPVIDNKKPTLVHTPSAKGTKGTKYVRSALENLKQKGLLFEYIEIHNQTRQEAINAIGKADMFIDQFFGGSYGLATCEAMAMGKPVFCYLMPAVVQKLPTDCPIVNTTIDTLEEVLEKYILDAQLRHDTGKLSRAYAEKYHDADKIALQLIELFKKDLNIN